MAIKEDGRRGNWQRILGQVLLAVGGVLALGGLASFEFPRVELRALKTVVSSVEGRLAWVIANALLAIIGLWLIRRYRRTSSPAG